MNNYSDEGSKLRATSRPFSREIRFRAGERTRVKVHRKTNTPERPRTRVSSVVASSSYGNVQDAATAARREGRQNFAAVNGASVDTGMVVAHPLSVDSVRALILCNYPLPRLIFFNHRSPRLRSALTLTDVERIRPCARARARPNTSRDIHRGGAEDKEAADEGEAGIAGRNGSAKMPSQWRCRRRMETGDREEPKEAERNGRGWRQNGERVKSGRAHMYICVYVCMY